MDVVPELIRAATKSIVIEQQYIKAKQPNVRVLLECISHARRENPALKVRIILGKIFSRGDLEKERENLAVLAESFDLQLDSNIRYINTDRLVHCHNKMVIVDGDAVLVSSQNWSDFAVTRNREAGLWMPHRDIAQYFQGIFDVDWRTAFRRPEDLFDDDGRYPRGPRRRRLHQGGASRLRGSVTAAPIRTPPSGPAMTLYRQRGQRVPRLHRPGSFDRIDPAPHVHWYASPASGQWYSTLTARRNPQASCVERLNKVPSSAASHRPSPSCRPYVTKLRARPPSIVLDFAEDPQARNRDHWCWRRRSGIHGLGIDVVGAIVNQEASSVVMVVVGDEQDGVEESTVSLTVNAMSPAGVGLGVAFGGGGRRPGRRGRAWPGWSSGASRLSVEPGAVSLVTFGGSEDSSIRRR